MEKLFRGIFDSDITEIIPVSDFLLCVGCSLIIGLLIAFTYMYKTKCTQSFVTTLALLPTIVCIVIMMVNGNIGTGVAVAGAFSLVRFRSAQGTAKEIGMLFMAMGSGLIAGMGYLAYAVLFAIIMCGISFLYSFIRLGQLRHAHLYKTIHITIPEDLDYTNVFEEIFKDYVKEYELVQVKTTNLGSLFRLSYDIILKEDNIEKEFIDKIRCRNGNLEITISKQETVVVEL